MSANQNQFRQELQKLMPGYSWTVHKPIVDFLHTATGVQTSGFNRISTLSVTRRLEGNSLTYEVKSAGFGRRSPWLHSYEAKTLAKALRGLQDHYEAVALKYRVHADDLQRGRTNNEKQHCAGYDHLEAK